MATQTKTNPATTATKAPAARKAAAPKPASTNNTSGSVTLHFTFEKETPGTNRYREDGDRADHVVGTLYVKKAALKKLGNPSTVTVAITAP